MLPSCQKYQEESARFWFAERSARVIGPPAIHPHALDSLYPNELDADVVAAVLFAGQRDQRPCCFSKIRETRDHRRYFFGASRSVQAVARKQQNILSQKLVLVNVWVHYRITAHRAAELMAHFGGRCLLFRQQPQLDLLMHNCVIVCQRSCMA